MALTQQQISANILDKASAWGEAQTQMRTALMQAKQIRENAMIALGADYTSQTGKTLSVEDAATLMGNSPQDFGKGKITTGYSMTGQGLSGITQDAVGTAYAADVRRQDTGITTESGIRKQDKTLVGDAANIERIKAIQSAQADIAEGEAGIVEARGNVLAADASLKAARGIVKKTPGKTKTTGKNKTVKPVVKPVGPKQKAAEARAAAKTQKKKGK